MCTSICVAKRRRWSVPIRIHMPMSDNRGPNTQNDGYRAEGVMTNHLRTVGDSHGGMMGV
ncbi:MAG: hypothetical protein QOG01_4338 [Pseudonocardiales bacterium]|nr:hypothetical protein [Pseudonocardiales bacterium]